MKPETPEERAARLESARLAHEATELLRAAGLVPQARVAQKQGPDAKERRRYRVSNGRRGSRPGTVRHNVAFQADERRVLHFSARIHVRVATELARAFVSRATAAIKAAQETEK